MSHLYAADFLMSLGATCVFAVVTVAGLITGDWQKVVLGIPCTLAAGFITYGYCR